MNLFISLSFFALHFCRRSSQSAGRIINKAIEKALKEADQNGIKGKEVTPYLLAAIAKITSGKSLETST